MPDVIICPGCQRKLRLPEGCNGRQTQCPACATRFFPPTELGPVEVFEARPADPAPEIPRPAPRPARSRPEEDYVPPRVPATRRRPIPQLRNQGLPWWGILLIVVGVLTAVGTCVVGLGVVLRNRLQVAAPNRAVVPEDAGQRRQEIEEAFHNQKPLAADEIAREVKPLFDDLGAAFQAADGPRIMDHFNLDRLLDEMAALNGMPEIQRGAFRQGFRVGMERSLTQQAGNFSWTGSEIRHVKKLVGNEAVVIVRHRAPGQSLKLRWWVTKRQGTWQVFDFEELTTGIRVTTVMGPIKHIDPLRMNAMGEGLKVLQAAMQDLAQRQDADAADKKLRQIVGVQFPPKVEALRVMTTGIIQLHHNQVQEALASFDKARGLHPDMVLLDLLQGRAYNHLGQWDKALKHLEAYRKLLGDDEDVCPQLGAALAGVRRFPEACAAYRKALDFAPKDADAFLGLLQALGPDDKRDDLAVRFMRLANRAENFATFAEECKGNQDGASLHILATAMRRVAPASAAPPYYLALCKAWAGQADEAVGLFRIALAMQPDADKRRDCAAGFFEAMAKADTAVEAYAAAPDPKEAFRVLAGGLHKRHEGGELRQLVAAHARKVPDDRLLPFYRGEVLVWDGHYRKGEEAFAAGLRKPPDKYTVDTFRASRVLARFHTGNALSAYKAIKPRDETFRQLAPLCLQEDKPDQLEALLDAHAKAVPTDADLPRHRCLLRVKQGRIAEAFALLKVVLAKQPNDAGRTQVENEFFRTAVAAGKAVEAYGAAPDAKRAFASMASQYEDDGPWDGLRPVLEEHRKRHPEDVWGFYYAGQLHMQEKAWDKAARVLGEGWKKAPEKLRESLRWPYVEAEYRAGRGLRVYEIVRPRKATFTQLANLMAGDKKWAEVEALVAAHRRHAGDDPELFFQEARAKVFRGKTAEAVALLGKAYRGQKEQWRRSGYVGTFVTAMREMGKGLEGYRAAPDPSAAFETLAGWLLGEKKADDLARLIAEHGKRHPGDLIHSLYAGELCLLQGNAKGAERILAPALPKAPRTLHYRLRHALLRARVRAGRAVVAYQERGKGKASFEEVASACFQARNTGHLEAMIGIHRLRRPDDMALVLWDIKARWLARDYEAAVKQMTEHHDDVFAPARYRWEFEDYLVRGLVRLKRYPEAVREAEAVARRRFGNRQLLVLARAAQGDVKQTIAAVAAAGSGQQRQDFVTRCYADEDLGPLLRGKGFEAFRTTFPERKVASRDR